MLIAERFFEFRPIQHSCLQQSLFDLISSTSTAIAWPLSYAFLPPLICSIASAFLYASCIHILLALMMHVPSLRGRSHTLRKKVRLLLRRSTCSRIPHVYFLLSFIEITFCLFFAIKIFVCLDAFARCPDDQISSLLQVIRERFQIPLLPYLAVDNWRAVGHYASLTRTSTTTTTRLLSTSFVCSFCFALVSSGIIYNFSIFGLHSQGCPVI